MDSDVNEKNMRGRRGQEFSVKTKNLVASRVALKCSNPKCRVYTMSANTRINKTTNVGVAAHMTAASFGGPRYDSSLSRTERISVENAIWLCQVCAKIIDDDPAKYDVQLLKNWKKTAEEMSQNELGKKDSKEFFGIEKDKRKIALAEEVIKIFSEMPKVFDHIRFWAVFESEDIEFGSGLTNAERIQKRFAKYRHFFDRFFEIHILFQMYFGKENCRPFESITEVYQILEDAAYQIIYIAEDAKEKHAILVKVLWCLNPDDIIKKKVKQARDEMETICSLYFQGCS
jgi:hypothetical protein